MYGGMRMRTRMKLCALWIVWLCTSAAAQYSSDQCSWRGSGLTHEPQTRDVEQVYLRCSEGSLEWLYPTGAIIVNIRPNTIPQTGVDSRMMACVKPRGDSSGSSLYVERAGRMRLLIGEEEMTARRVRCFNLDEGALFIQASVQTDISKRVTAFQYQLIRRDTETPADTNSLTDTCRPCTNEEILMAVCTSDFVVKGSIQFVEDNEEQSLLLVSVSHVYRQKRHLFGPHGRQSGRIQVPISCGIRAGQWAGLGEFMFTGAMRFGEARLGCAPRYKDFLQLYMEAVDSGSNPCYIDVV